MRTLLSLSLALLFTSSAFGITYRPDKDDNEFIKYGNEHSCVVRVKCLKANSSPLHAGSGTLIAPRVVVTAAHVVTGGSNQVIEFNGNDYGIVASVCPKDFNMKMSNGFGKYDIAVCYLEKPVDLDHFPELYGEKDEDGKICSISGWGRHGNFNNGYSYKGSSVRRAGSNFVEKIEQELLICMPSKKGDGTRMTTLEAIVAPGDSGGGLFIDGKLAGVHSLLMTKDAANIKTLNGGYSNQSGSTRVSLYKDWILKTAEQIEGHFKISEEAQEAINELRKVMRDERR